MMQQFFMQIGASVQEAIKKNTSAVRTELEKKLLETLQGEIILTGILKPQIKVLKVHSELE